MIYIFLHLLLLLLGSTDAAACKVAMHGTSLRMDCAAENLGSNGVDPLFFEDKLGEFPGVTSLSLDLQHNQIGDAGVSVLGAALQKTHTLTSLTLQLDGNSIGDAGAQSLVASIANMESLTSLSLSLQYGDIGTAGFGDMGASLCALTDLEELTLKLRFNHVGSAGLGAFGRNLGRMTSLNSLNLDLYSNSIGDAGVSDFASSVSALTRLESLSMDLRYNAVTTVGSNDLLAVLHGMKKLTSTSIALPTVPSPAPLESIDHSALADVLKEAMESVHRDEASPKKQADSSIMEEIADSKGPLDGSTLVDREEARAGAPETVADKTDSEKVPSRPQVPFAGETVHTNSTKVLITTTIESTLRDDSSTEPIDAPLPTDPDASLPTESVAEDTSGPRPLVWFFAILLLGVFVAGALQAQGVDVLHFLQNARTVFQERALPVLLSAGASLRERVSSLQARDYTSNLSSAVLDTEAPSQEVPIFVQKSNDNNYNPRAQDTAAGADAAAASFNPRGPDLAARVDAAAAKVNAARREPAANVSIEDLLHQNLSSMHARDQME